MNENKYISDEAAYAMENSVENACGLVGFVCETWATTNGGGGTCRDSWLESKCEVSLNDVLNSPTKHIDGKVYLVCVKDGVAYVRHGEKGNRPLQHIAAHDSAHFNVYATYGAEVDLSIKARFE